MAARTRRFLAAAAVIVSLLLIGDVIPRFVLTQFGKVPADYAVTATTRPADLTIDFVTQPGATLTTTVTTSAVPESETTDTTDTTDPKKALDVTASVDLADAFHVSETTRVLRESGYPVTAAVASISKQTPWGQSSYDHGEREGLEYFFPPNTEKRSYPFYDMVADKSAPIDFVSEVDRGTTHYLFHQRLDAIEMPSIDEITGPASAFFTPEEIERFGYNAAAPVTLRPFYSVERTIEVEPETGTIIDRHEAYSIYYAADQPQARALSNPQAPAPQRAALSYDAEWDEATVAAAQAHARPVTKLFDALAILAWITKAILAAFAVWLIWRVVRNRRRTS